MPRLLLNLHRVPEEEADGVRAFLDAHGIAWYETQPSRWGISHGGIWIKRKEDEAQARRLMDEFQSALVTRVRAEHDRARREGTHEGFADLVRNQPVRVLLAVVGIVLLLGLVALPGWLLRP